MKKLLFSKLLFTILFLIATPVSAKMLWEYGDFNERAEMAVDNGIVANVSEYQGTYEQNVSLLSVIEKNGKIEYLGASTQPAALTTYNLAGSGVSSSATSLTLQSLTIPQNDYSIQDSDLSDTFYVTLEPGSKVRQEIASCTTVVQNSGGTATLSGCTRGLSPITPYTASSTLQFSHAGGSQVIFSDPPQLFNSYPAKANSETITGRWKYDVLPETSSSLTATTSNQFTTKEYVDNTTNQGAATSTESVAGISELATRTETASSTPFDANNPHVMSSENATSTPYADSIGAGYACVTEDDGNISLDCLPTSEDWTFSGDNTFSGGNSLASTTFTASTTWDILPEYDSDPIGNDEATRKSYVDTEITSGIINYKSGVGSVSPSKQEQTIAHGLSETPDRIKVVAMFQTVSESPIISDGVYDGTNFDTVWMETSSTGGDKAGTDTSSVAYLRENTDNYMVATSTVDGTNIYLGWEETGTFPSTIYYRWEAWGTLE